MSTLLVTFQLTGPPAGYGALRDALQSTGVFWGHLERSWVVGTDETPDQLRDRLVPHLDRRDRLLVVDISDQVSAWSGFPADAHAWLADAL